MYVVGIDAPSEEERQRVFRRLADRLGYLGVVGTVTDASTDSVTDGGGSVFADPASDHVDRSISFSGNRTWVEAGRDLSLATALDRLAVDCDVALVSGFDDSRIARVVVGEVDAEEAIATAPSADDLDLDAVAAAVEDLEPYETLESLVADVKRSSDADRAGAIATFTGRVRAQDSEDDDPTEYLEFERYDELAEERTASLWEDLASREGVYDVRLHHKTGVVEAGEDIVFVVVLAGHRREAFRTVEDGIDRLKAEVPLFKKEVTVSDEFWAHER